MTIAAAYQQSPEYNPILGAASRRLRRRSPPSKLDYLVREDWNFGVRQVEIWFRSKGCHYFLQGGCTMCNYGYSALKNPSVMVDYVAQALSTLKLDETIDLMVSPSGSFLDPWEVPPDVRATIMAGVAKLPWRQFGFETQANFIGDAVLKEVSAAIGNRPVKIAIGLESFDADVRRLCINKDLPQSTFLEAISCASRHGMDTSVNVVIGSPFLGLTMQVADTTASANALAALGVTEIFLFPVNVKVGTLVEWLWRRGHYVPPSLWTLLHIILSVDEHVRQRIAFAWHKEYYTEFDDVSNKVVHRPMKAELFKSEMLELSGLLENFLMTRDAEPLSRFASRSDAYRAWVNDLHEEVGLVNYGAVIEELIVDVLGAAWRDRHAVEISNFTAALAQVAGRTLQAND